MIVNSRLRHEFCRLLFAFFAGSSADKDVGWVSNFEKCLEVP